MFRFESKNKFQKLSDLKWKSEGYGPIWNPRNSILVRESSKNSWIDDSKSEIFNFSWKKFHNSTQNEKYPWDKKSKKVTFGEFNFLGSYREILEKRGDFLSKS